MIKKCLIGTVSYVAGATPKIVKDYYAIISTDGIMEKIVPTITEVKTYYTGDAVQDKKVNGVNYSYEFTTKDYSRKKIAKNLPFFDYDDVTGTTNYLLNTNYSFSDNSKIYLIHPMEAIDDSQDTLVYKGAITNGLELAYHGINDDGYKIILDSFPVMVKNTDGTVSLAYGRNGAWEAEYLTKLGILYSASETFDGKAVK